MTKPYKVTITETLSMTVEVNAEDLADAEELVADQWSDGKYVLDAECFSDVKFEAKPRERAREHEHDTR